MPEEIPKEVIEFMTRFGGATVSAIEEFVFEYYASHTPGAPGKFPFNRPLQQLPMWYDFIVAGLQLPPWLIGLLVKEDAKKKGDTKTAEIADAVEDFGEGGLLYIVPTLAHHTVVQTVGHKPAGAPPPEGTPPPGQPTQTVGIVYKL